MKGFVLLFSIIMAPSAFAVLGGPEVVQVDNLFVPQGYDDNDIIEVVISGTFGDSCHQVGDPIVKIDKATRTVTIAAIGYRELGVMCVQMLSPYTYVVRIGRMGEGEYVFKIANNKKIEKRMSVKKATIETVDDFLYPPIDFAEILPGPDGEARVLLKGRYPEMKKGCMKLADALIDLQSSDTMVIQPKATIIEDTSVGCEQSFEAIYQLPYALAGKVLLHVRTSNGQSYNRLEKIN